MSPGFAMWMFLVYILFIYLNMNIGGTYTTCVPNIMPSTREDIWY